MALREDIYGGGPQNELLRYWLSVQISRELAEQSLGSPGPAALGSFIVRRSISSPGDYAITVCEGDGIKSYKVHDLGCGQVGIQTGQAFASLEHLLEFFFDKPFPSDGGAPLRIMHQYLAGMSGPSFPAPAPAPSFQPPVPGGHPSAGGRAPALPGGHPSLQRPPNGINFGSNPQYGEVETVYDTADGFGAPPSTGDDGTYGEAVDSIPSGFGGAGAAPPLQYGAQYGDAQYGDAQYGDAQYGDSKDMGTYGDYG